MYSKGSEKTQVTLDGKEEEDILRRFEEIVRDANPDFIFAPEMDNFALPYLKTRSETLGIDLNLGREAAGEISSRVKKLGLYMAPGRVCLDFSNYGYSFDDNGWGIAGLIERSRFACLPPNIAGRWTANRVNDSRVCFELIKRGHVIPKNRGAFEFVRSLSAILQASEEVLPKKFERVDVVRTEASLSQVGVGLHLRHEWLLLESFWERSSL